MKIAGGCFGCLALVFLVLTILWGMITAAVGSAVATTQPEAWSAIGPFFGYGQYVNSGCCCLSSILAIGLFAFSASRSRDGIE
jgi:hypothetical protein